MIGNPCAVAVAGSFVSMLVLCHKYGVREWGLDWATETTATMYDNANRLLESPSGPRHWVLVFAGIGAGVMALLVMLYYRFPWWPIHPIGYLAAYSSGMKILWFSFFIGWLCNHICLHYGGAALFKQVRNLFLGFIIGDFVMGGVFAIIGLFTGYSYQVLPV